LSDWHRRYQAFRHHLFVLITLLGCLAPWVTPRHFAIHTGPSFSQGAALTTVIRLSDLMSTERHDQEAGRVGGSEEGLDQCLIADGLIQQSRLALLNSLGERR
jgi:hypothetical protein